MLDPPLGDQDLTFRFADMVDFNINSQTSKGIKSKKLDSFSVTYGDTSNGAYPDNIINSLMAYRSMP